jgi:hypothetical protein
MSMVCGLDLHRQQITFDALDTRSGEAWRGRVWQPDRVRVRRWLRCDVARRADGEPVVMAVEGCTGWRYVVEEIEAAGFEAHLAEPADTQVARGKKHRATTDRSDARLLRVVGAWGAARVVDRSSDRVGVAGTGAVVQLAGRSAAGVDAADPRRAVPARRRRTRSGDPLGLDTGAVGRRRGDFDAGGPPADRGRVRDDRRRRRPIGAVEERPPTLRDPPAGVSGAGRRGLRDRRVDGGGGVVRARRLPSLLPLRPGGPSHRVGRRRGRLGPASRRRLPVPARTPGVALGAGRSGDQRVAPAQPRSPRSTWRHRARPRRWSKGAGVGRTGGRHRACRRGDVAVERAAAPARRPSGRTGDRGRGGGVRSISVRRLSLGKRGHASPVVEAEAGHGQPAFCGDTRVTVWSGIIAWARLGCSRAVPGAPTAETWLVISSAPLDYVTLTRPAPPAADVDRIDGDPAAAVVAVAELDKPGAGMKYAAVQVGVVEDFTDLVADGVVDALHAELGGQRFCYGVDVRQLRQSFSARSPPAAARSRGVFQFRHCPPPPPHASAGPEFTRAQPGASSVSGKPRDPRFGSTRSQPFGPPARPCIRRRALAANTQFAGPRREIKER